MTGPLPPGDLNSRSPRLLEIAADTIIHRFHTAAHEPVFYDRSKEGRLNSPDGGYGVLYAAKRSQGAFAETFLRTPGRRMLDPGLLERKAYVRLRTTRTLTLVDFDGPGLPVLGATAEVVHAGLPYDAPQAWSRALHAHPVNADGIAYTARHDPHQVCYALFDRACSGVKEHDRSHKLDADWFWRLAETYEVSRAP